MRSAPFDLFHRIVTVELGAAGREHAVEVGRERHPPARDGRHPAMHARGLEEDYGACFAEDLVDASALLNLLLHRTI